MTANSMTDSNTLQLALSPDSEEPSPTPAPAPTTAETPVPAQRSPTPPPSTFVDKPAKRHSQYYIPNGDVVFQVQETLFRVHRYFFERESALFRDMLALPAPSDTEREGMSDENPIHLPQVEGEEFSRFLWVFYNPTYSNYRTTVEEWKAILKLAHRWQFPEIRDLAFRELDKMSIDPVSRLVLAERYDAAPSWRVKSLLELANRREPLSVQEGRALGVEISVQVAELRERAQGFSMGDRSRTRRRHRHYSHSRSRSRESHQDIVRVEPTPPPPQPIIIHPQTPPQIPQPQFPPTPTLYGEPGIVPILPADVHGPHNEHHPWVLPPSSFGQPPQFKRILGLGRMSKFIRSVFGRS